MTLEEVETEARLMAEGYERDTVYVYTGTPDSKAIKAIAADMAALARMIQELAGHAKPAKG